MVSDRFFVFHMHNPFGKPLSLACGIRGHQCFTNTSCYFIFCNPILQRGKKTDLVAIMGSFHQSSPEVFQHSAAGAQCTSMSLAAIVASSLKNVNAWNSEFVDNVVKGGDRLHLEILKSKQWPCQRIESRLAVDELPKKFKCRIGRQDVTTNSEYEEPLFGFSSYVDSFVLTSIINHPNQSFILRMYDFSIAILCNNNQYSIFDSHAKNSEGIIDGNGTADLFNFPSPSEMVKYLSAQQKGKMYKLTCIQSVFNF